MPVYEFVGRGCGAPFEGLASRTGERPVACPACGGPELERQLSVFAVSTRARPVPGPCGEQDCACRHAAESSGP